MYLILEDCFRRCNLDNTDYLTLLAETARRLRPALRRLAITDPTRCPGLRFPFDMRDKKPSLRLRVRPG